MPTSAKANKIASWSILAILLIALGIKTFFVGYYRIPQNGMYPGLPAGSSLFTAKRAYSSVSSVKRGDIVIFVREENGRRYNYIWRVIALPGEKVEASDEALKINGQPVQRQRGRVAIHQIHAFAASTPEPTELRGIPERPPAGPVIRGAGS